MILDELVLHDFGTYRGRHVFNLTPESPEQPIILIGAQNGAGKTTFLEGLQLALYGRLAQNSLRGTGGYDAYLEGAINRLAAPQDGAQVELKFRRTAAGKEFHYHVRRSWVQSRSNVRETFEVMVDEKLDHVLTQHWAEFVEEMLPPRIAPLFFFDGEKIEQFADLKNSSEIIGVAIKALLGLDIVERLELDLEVLERRKLSEQAKADVRTELAAAEAEAEAATARQRELVQQMASIRTRRDRCAAAVQKSRAELKRHGGDLFASREDLQGQKLALESQLNIARKEIRSWAGEAGPLLLVRSLVGEVREQAAKEADTTANRIILRHLETRDLATTRWLSAAGGDLDLLQGAEAFLASDRQRLAEQTYGDTWLNLSGSGQLAAETLLDSGLDEAGRDLAALLDQELSLSARLTDLDRQLSAIPAVETIRPLLAEVEIDEADLRECEMELFLASRALEVGEREVASARAGYQTRLDQQVRASLQIEDSDRVVRHSVKARATLDAFKREVVNHHVHRLERFVLEALRALLRKEDLITDVKIDPATFAIQLRDSGWAIISPEQLSAGERQLLAIALLWALARASGQAAPTVIDTPLGRLDSHHRSRLVDRYFPFAGEQVILLSTDQEIDAALYDRLEQRISRSFTIRYDSGLGGSTVEKGYAFAKVAQEAA